MEMGVLFYLLILSLQFQESKENAAANDTENILIQTLLTSYNINTRPILDKSQPVIVRMEVVPRQLIKLDERNQLLTINAWLRLYWKDEHLTWDESDYEGISNVRIYPTTIWRPDIVLYNEVSDQQQDLGGLYPAIINSNGSVEWLSKQIYKTTCPMDVSNFPWDTQRCKLLYSSWTYDSQGIDLNVSTLSAETDSFTLNGEWVLEDIPITKFYMQATCCIHPYSMIEFTMILRRKPLYYIVYLVIPALCITLVGTMVFCLPVDSGEKVSLSVTVLLSSTVFLTMISDELPTQSDVIPLAGEFFLVVIVCMSISTMLTVMVLNVHSHGQYGTRVPRPIRKVFIEHLGRALMCTRKDGMMQKKQKKTKKENHTVRNPNLARSVVATSVLAPTVAGQKKLWVEPYDENRYTLFPEQRNGPRQRENRLNSSKHLSNGVLPGYSEHLTERGNFGEHSGDEQDNIDKEWVYLALVMDRIFLIVFLFSLILACLGVILVPG